MRALRLLSHFRMICYMFRFSWKWRRRSPTKLMERTHQAATKAIRAGRKGRHPEAALAGEGTHLEVVR